MGSQYLVHHGVKGQKWGVRRYQNPDGTLTEEGYRYYGIKRRNFRERDNVKDTGRRSAISSAKSTAKSQAKWGAVGAVGTLVAGTFLGAPAVAAASIAGAEYVASLGATTAAGALLGRTQGRQAAKRQNSEIQNQIISGNSFVVSQLTATSTVNIVGPYRSVKTSVTSKR